MVLIVSLRSTMGGEGSEGMEKSVCVGGLLSSVFQITTGSSIENVPAFVAWLCFLEQGKEAFGLQEEPIQNYTKMTSLNQS